MKSFFSNYNVLFDLDGTLVNSDSLHYRAYRRAITKYMPALLPNFNYVAISGKSTREAFMDMGVDNHHDLETLTCAKQELYREEILKNPLDLLPGARQLLLTLKTKDCNLFLVTSGCLDSVMPSLRSNDITRFFNGIITANDVQHGKPSPEPYLLCLERFGLDSFLSVVVEDSGSGVTAGKKAGLLVVGVNNTNIMSISDLFFRSLSRFERWLHFTDDRKGCLS